MGMGAEFGNVSPRAATRRTRDCISRSAVTAAATPSPVGQPASAPAPIPSKHPGRAGPGWLSRNLRRSMGAMCTEHTPSWRDAARVSDQGAPVSTYTVAREMGHGGEAMVRKVYGHLGQVRHRSEAVEYRVEQHVTKLEAAPP